MKKPKILFWDIETAPNLAYVWGMYEQNVIEVKENWSILSFSYKWQGDGQPHVLSLRSFTGNAAQKEQALVKRLHKVLSEADILVAHNGDEFDVKKAKARFIYYNLKPLRPVPSVDTLKVAKKHFNFNSNKLDSIARHLGLGRKVKTQGFELWLGCMANKKKSWKLMEKYNKHDVTLLEKVYNKLLPWMHTHPNIALLQDRKIGCPKCGSKRVVRRGLKANNQGLQQQWNCNDCKGWHVTRRM